jgi:hypothetical protein
VTKQEILELLRVFQTDLKALKKAVSSSKSDRIAAIGIRQSAEALATKWVEDLRSPLESVLSNYKS